MLDAAGVPAGPILNIDELLADPHLNARGMIVEIDHPVVGRVKYPGNPIQFSKASPVFNRAPLLGEHTESILKELLQCSEGEIRDVLASQDAAMASPGKAEEKTE